MAFEKKSGTFADFSCKEEDAVRRDNSQDVSTVWRSAFIRDTDKILHCPFYNRYADKTQVFSFYKNDDITRRSLHVQLVSRTARTIGKALNLNDELIESIALGHDIGHTPFGHSGERLLDEMLFGSAGLHFSHNIHSVRVLDRLFPLNLSLQTLSGIAGHDGEFEISQYSPKPLSGFAEFDCQMDNCYKDKANVKKLVPSTLEGCVVRITDIIAYLGKDRQDAERAHIAKYDSYNESGIGATNPEIINNLMVNIIENSYGKPYIMLDKEHFEALTRVKRDNYDRIYKNSTVLNEIDIKIRPMMEKVFKRLLSDLKSGKSDSPIMRHHVNYVCNLKYDRNIPYTEEQPEMIVTDYIASMTDDYFVDLFSYLFPKEPCPVKYHGYF